MNELIIITTSIIGWIGAVSIEPIWMNGWMNVLPIKLSIAVEWYCHRIIVSIECYYICMNV